MINVRMAEHHRIHLWDSNGKLAVAFQWFHPRRPWKGHHSNSNRLAVVFGRGYIEAVVVRVAPKKCGMRHAEKKDS